MTATSEEEDEETRRFLLPRIAALHEEVRTLNDEKLMPRVFYFARSVKFQWESEKRAPGIIEHYEALSAIQAEGVAYHLNPLFSEEERLKSGLLYRTSFNVVMAGSIPDNRRGCSASVCSNCAEPIAYCHAICAVCSYPLIGPHGYYHRQYEDFLQLATVSRISLHDDAFGRMSDDILASGRGRAWNDPHIELGVLYRGLGVSISVADEDY